MTTSNETYEKGLQIRREVIGADYADEQSADGFSREYQNIVNEQFWGGVSGRIYCPPVEQGDVKAALAISFSMWQCAAHGDAAGPGFVH